jgi:hypothetical protein
MQMHKSKRKIKTKLLNYYMIFGWVFVDVKIGLRSGKSENLMENTMNIHFKIVNCMVEMVLRLP